VACDQKLHRDSTTSSISTCSSSLATEYPVGLVVRNGFQDSAMQRPVSFDIFLDRPLSLDGFLEVRQVHSAPTSQLEDASNPAPDHSKSSQSSVAAESEHLEPMFVPIHGLPASLQLAGLIPEPQLGSAELPTVGSKKHRLGQCKPCAFIWKGTGCDNGVDCSFCHLCDVGEKRRRAKEKKARIRVMRASSHGLREAMFGFGGMIS